MSHDIGSISGQRRARHRGASHMVRSGFSWVVSTSTKPATLAFTSAGQARQTVWVAIPPMLCPTRITRSASDARTTAPSASAKRSIVKTPSLGGFDFPRPGRSHVTSRKRAPSLCFVNSQAVELRPQPWVRISVGPAGAPKLSTFSVEPSGATADIEAPRFPNGVGPGPPARARTTKRPRKDHPRRPAASPISHAGPPTCRMVPSE